jgi:NADH-quinone oxidoreductase subunit M
MVILTLSSIGLPGLNGFVGEFLLLLGMFQRAWADASAILAAQYRVIAVLALSGVVLGAWYMLQLVQRVFFGPLRTPTAHSHAESQPPPADLSLRESLALGLLVVFILWIGLQPRFFLDRMSPTLEKILAPAAQSLARDGRRVEEGERGREGEGETRRYGDAAVRREFGVVASPPLPLSLSPTLVLREPTHAH